MYISTTVIESDPVITATYHEARGSVREESVQLTLGNRAGVIFLAVGEAEQLVAAITAALADLGGVQGLDAGDRARLDAVAGA